MALMKAIKRKIQSAGKFLEEMADPSIRVRRVRAERRGEKALKVYKRLRRKRVIKEALKKREQMFEKAKGR